MTKYSIIEIIPAMSFWILFFVFLFLKYFILYPISWFGGIGVIFGTYFIISMICKILRDYYYDIHYKKVQKDFLELFPPKYIIKDNVIQRDDGAMIPIDINNKDYQKYLEWIKEPKFGYFDNYEIIVKERE
jgi:hypothetical protein